MEANDIRAQASAIEDAMVNTIGRVGSLQIGAPGQFPFGWRRAAKGRTVWRLVEELLIQNMEAHADLFAPGRVEPADSEVGVFDFSVGGPAPSVFVNIKASGVSSGGRSDDVSKARRIVEFMDEHPDELLCLASVALDFEVGDLSELVVNLKSVTVTPLPWLPSFTVNRSNGNLQGKFGPAAPPFVERTNEQFGLAVQALLERQTRAA